MQKKKKAVPSEHWEIKYTPSPKGKEDQSGIRTFDPRSGKDRPVTHIKVNETDH